MNRFYLSIGANIGQREQNLAQAVFLLRGDNACSIQHVSSLYETMPWGKIDQPMFLNAALTVDSTYTGSELLQRCLQIEKKLGRIRQEKWGTRTIDIDIVYSRDEVCTKPDLQIPHPYLTKRAFVLVPLQEIEPTLEIEGRPIGEWLTLLVKDVSQMHKYGKAKLWKKY